MAAAGSPAAIARQAAEQQYLLAEALGPGYARATGTLRLYMAQLRRKPDPARPRPTSLAGDRTGQGLPLPAGPA